MSTITVNGIVDNQEPIRTHLEPTGPIEGNIIAAGGSSTILVTGFKNTGNVPQTLSVAIGNIMGASISWFRLEVNGAHMGGSATLNPDQGCVLRVDVKAPAAAPGEDTEYSFSIDTTWA